MKAGPFEFYWNPGPNTVAAEVRDYLADAPEVQRAIARMARSEVKNYLAGLAEEAEVPFLSPGAFLRGLQAALSGTAGTNLQRDPDDPFDPATDPPFTATHTVLDPRGLTIYGAEQNARNLMKTGFATEADLSPEDLP